MSSLSSIDYCSVADNAMLQSKLVIQKDDNGVTQIVPRTDTITASTAILPAPKSTANNDEMISTIVSNSKILKSATTTTTSNDDKLPLKNGWSFYFYKADKQRDWKQNVIYITSVSYVEDFWSFYTHTYGLRDLSNGSDYMIFKFGCLPMWEDLSSRGGGKWAVTIDSKKRKRDLDGYWLHLMLLLIGDIFGELSVHINGAVVSLRVKGDRLALWLKKVDDENIIKAIGMKFKDLLGFQAKTYFVYEYHEPKIDSNEIRLTV
ncbi:unnamed protein product [Didymodactylos carnosus]|uniref:Eukaryotic translation initiation factor 4E n=1 Tax=Didymodactylos carnosus TaxID=1234261 RepID=A0A814BQ33_9BILA|nr:unnamed protein product [Didymodactylos carnosus]CAF3709190.1 unnamed protein product [Didymodactylos carnosus]